MILSRLHLLIALATAPLLAQTPPAKLPPPPAVHDAEFTYHLPDDWQRLTPKPPAPAQQRKEEQKTPDLDVKKGISCLEVPLTARHGVPASVIVVVVLPIACYGQPITENSLPDLGAGAAAGLKQSFTVTGPVTASYTVAGHRMWIERARGIPLGKTTPAYTLEIACTVLKKEAVCWLAQAADESSLQAFESTPVTLDGQAAPALVPEDTFLHDK